MNKLPDNIDYQRLGRHLSNFFLLLFWLLVSTNTWSHSTGENYVWINASEDHLEGRFEMRLEDLRTKLGLDIPETFDAAEESLRLNEGVVHAYIQQHFTLSADARALSIEFRKTSLLRANRLGHFAQYAFRTAQGDIAESITIRNTLFLQDDYYHRSLLLVEYDNRNGKQYGVEHTALVFSQANSEQLLDFNDIGSLLSNLDFVWQGILHIWIGIDHILFLVALLIPAVLVRTENAWVPVDDFNAAFWKTFKIVTLFTLAHSITLALAALEIVQLPSRLVESIIAASIIVVALNNIYPIFRNSVWGIIFIFGLFHGLGFASVMAELPFRMQDLAWVILSFNIGVELGQLAVVGLIVPLIYWLRMSLVYQRYVPVYGSWILAIVAGYWFAERALGIS